MKHIFLLIISTFCLLPVASFATIDFYIQDDAKVISQKKENELRVRLAEFAKESNKHIVFITEKKIPISGVDSVGEKYFKNKGISRDIEHNSIIIRFFIKEKQIAYEVGYHLVENFTEEDADKLVDEVYTLLDEKRYEDGIESAIGIITEALTRVRPDENEDIESEDKISSQIKELFPNGVPKEALDGVSVYQVKKDIDDRNQSRDKMLIVIILVIALAGSLAVIYKLKSKLKK